jgi:hypothetical protein
MHPLLTFQPADLHCARYNPRAAAQEALRAEIVNAPTLASAAQIMQVDASRYKPRWTGEDVDPARFEGWRVSGSAAYDRQMCVSAYLHALAYARPLPRLRCPERRARAVRTIRACAAAVRVRAWHLDREVAERDAAEIEALLLAV